MAEILTHAALECGMSIIVDGSLRDSTWYERHFTELRNQFPKLCLSIFLISAPLEEIYQRVKSAGGNGKMRLRPDISPEEAKDLKDSLSDMRTLLVDELHSGIPEGTETESSPSEATAPEEASSESSSTTSKYKQMLEKARAEKEAKGGFQ